MKLDEKLAVALVNLRGNPDFRLFVERMGDDAEKLMEMIVMGDDDAPTTRDVQRGQARQITLIMKAIEDAPKIVIQLKQHEEPPHA